MKSFFRRQKKQTNKQEIKEIHETHSSPLKLVGVKNVSFLALIMVSRN